MIGLGIDTGGTCTDAVLWDLEKREILASAKALTTKEDLKVGIEAALSQLPEDLTRQCVRAAISTTLATNACVEGKGGRGKLILIGADEGAFRDTRASYGIEDPSDVLLVPCRLVPETERCTPPDWDAFRRQLGAFLSSCDCVSIVQLYSAELLGCFEKEAAKIVKEFRDIPVICGHTLFPDRNIFRRGAGALLNARLIPVLHEFLIAIREVLTRRGMDIPVTIVRSDGSQMSEAFAGERPVETLLSGPAASVIGAVELARSENALIVDMGGTTTDVSIVKEEEPEMTDKGVCIGHWKTFVKGLYVETFGLGGDTAIHYELSHGIRLEDYRVIPLCMLASRYPYVTEQLRELDESERIHGHFLHEFLTLVRQPREENGYSERELALCRALENGPLSLMNAAKAAGAEIYNLNTQHLEADGVVLRAGLTPTDIMHIRGDYRAFDGAASEYAASYVRKGSGISSVKKLCDSVYDAVTRRLYKNLLGILLKSQIPAFAGETPGEELSKYLDVCYEMAKSGEMNTAFFAPSFAVRADLIGVGAPAHVFLPRAAKLLQMRCIIPESAHVANAVGAIAGKITARVQIEVRGAGEWAGGGFSVNTGEKIVYLDDHEEAVEYALREGERLAEGNVRSRGAAGPVRIKKEVSRSEVTEELLSLWLSDTVTVTAEGTPGGA